MITDNKIIKLMKLRKVTILLLIATLITAFSSVQVYAQGLTAEDVVKLESVGSVAMSPNGEYVAYTLSVPRTDNDDVGRNFSELYIIQAAGGEAVNVIEKPNGAGSPAWGPDGRLYFTSSISDHHNQTQVYSVNQSGNDLQKHTEAENGVSSYQWTRDGSTVAYTSLDPVSEQRKEMEEKGFDMIVAGENIRYMGLYVQPRDGQATRITPDDLYVHDYSWAPNGEQLAVRVSEKTGADAAQMYT